MHILLTDILRCARCGPEFGLVLLAHRVQARRVLAGELGCPNCRLVYPVEGGFADLRIPYGEVREDEVAEVLERGGSEGALGLAALLGVAEGPGYIVLVGPAARFAPALACMIEGIEVVGVEPRLCAWEESPGVSRMAAGPGLPLSSRSVRAIAVSGAAADALLEEAVRTVASLGRVVVLDGPERAREALLASKLELIFEGEGTLVAQRTRAA